MTLSYNETRELSIRITDSYDQYNVIIEYKDPINEENGETYNNPYINCMVNKGFRGKYPITILHNTFHDNIYPQHFYEEMIEDLFESHLFDPIISPETLDLYGVHDGEAPPVNDNSP